MSSLWPRFLVAVHLMRSLKGDSGDVDGGEYNNWSLCAKGKRQSPIDLDIGKATVMRWTPIRFHHYDAVGYPLVSKNGHSELMKGFQSWTEQPFITGGGLYGKYILQQFHFHWNGIDSTGSEHTLGRLHYPMEIHFVHILEGYNASTAVDVPEAIAVVAVLLQVARKGELLMDLESVFVTTNLTSSERGAMEYRLEALLPKDTATFFRYEGSLTTPPCSEGVIWTVLVEPSYVTKHQLEFIRHHISMDEGALVHNWREIQPLHGRPLYLNKLKVLISSVKVEEVIPIFGFVLVMFTIALVSIHHMNEYDMFS